MRLPQILATIAAALLAVGTLNAQHYTIPAVACGAYSSLSYYCVPMTIIGADGVASGVFYHPKYNGQLWQIGFRGRDGFGTFTVRSVITTSTASVETQTVNGDWTDPMTGQKYNLTSTIKFVLYQGVSGGGRGGGSGGTKWKLPLPDGTMDIVRVDY